jgi:hypothetical protein
VNPVYDISKIEQLDEIADNLAAAMMASYHEGDMDMYNKKRKLVDDLVDIKAKVLEKFQYSTDVGSQVGYFTGKAFVTFTNEAYKVFVFEHYKRHPDYWNFQGLGEMKMWIAD